MMKRFTYILLVLILCGASYASETADISSIGMGARGLGIGRAYSVLADDASAIFSNPAGILKTEKFSVVSMSGNMLSEIPYMMAAGSYKMQNGVLGVGFVGASVSGINEAIIVNGTPEITGNTGSYANNVIVLSYASSSKISDRDLSYGVNLKLLSQGFSGSQSFEAGRSSGMDLDFGLLMPVNQNITASFALKNLMPGNNIGKYELPMSINAGVGYKAKDDLFLALDSEIGGNGFLLKAGAEWNPIDMLFLRGGVDQAKDGMDIAFGLGTKVKGFKFDYAYHTFAGISEFSSHFFSIGYIGEEKSSLPAIEKVEEVQKKVPVEEIKTPVKKTGKI